MSYTNDILENFVFPNVKYYEDVVNPTTFISRETLKKTIEDYFNRTEGSDCRERSSLNGTNTTDISNWDTSEITDMSNLFSNIKQISIEPIILNWDTSNVTNMSWMFYNCKQDFILNFNTSNVTNMSNMFYNAINFNQPLNFDTSNVTDMSWMFYVL